MSNRNNSIKIPLILIAASLLGQAQDVTKLSEVTVKGNFLSNTSKEDIQYFGGSRTLIDMEISKDLGDNSISDVIKRIPGSISSKQDGTGGSLSSLNIGIRGMPQRLSPKTTVLMDGIPLAVAPYGQPQLSLAPVSFNMLSEIDVIRGGGVVRYGPQNVGGIINFKTRSIPKDFTGSFETYTSYYTKGNSDLQNNSINLFTGGMITDKFGMALFYDGTHASTWREHSRNNIDNVMLKTKYKIHDLHTIKTRFSYYKADNEMPGGLTVAEYKKNPYQSKRPNDKFEGDRKELAITYEGQLSSDIFVDTKAYYNQSNREFTFAKGAPNISKRLDRLPREYEVLGLEGRVAKKIKITDIPTELTFGYRYIEEDANEKRYRRSHLAGNNPFNTAEVVNRNSDNKTKAHTFYTDWRWEVGNLTMTPGVRFEDVKVSRLNKLNSFYEDIDYFEVLPSLNLNYKLSDTWNVFTSYNRSFGSVQHLQLNLKDKGDNILEPELADIFEVGTRYLGDNANLETTLFYIDFDEQLGYSSTLNKWANQGQTVHKGIELAGKIYLDEVSSYFEGSSLYGNYSYLDAKYKDLNAGNAIEFTSKHTGLIGYEYLEEDWSSFAEVYYQSKQYSDNKNTQEENNAGSLGEIPGYALVNIGYKKNFDLSNDYKFSLSLGVKNLFDKETFTRSTDNLGNGKYIGMPRTPYFSLRIDY